MKKQYLAITTAILLSLSMGSIAMAQDSTIVSETNHNISAASTEISDVPVPYNPNIPVEAPKGTPKLNYSCSVTGVSSGSALNVRSSASNSGTVIGSFAAGATIYCEFTGEHPTPSGWWYASGTDKSSGKNIKGYVSADYVTCSPRSNMSTN